MAASSRRGSGESPAPDRPATDVLLDSEADSIFLPWVAGFFDGEGCVTVSKKATTAPHGINHSLFVSITQQDNRALFDIQSRFGGVVIADKHRSKRGHSVNHVVWRWRVVGLNAYQFLQSIAPYCKVKDQQVAVALGWPNPGENYRGRRLPRHIWTKRNKIMIELKRLRQSVKVSIDA